MNLLEFKVYGPFDITYSVNNHNAKLIDAESKREFWNEYAEEFGGKNGCYVFCLNYWGKTIPYYVGKACNGFLKEALADSKRNKYNEALHSLPKATPCIYFVVYPPKKGKTSEGYIDELETYLIQSALVVNPEIKNIQKTARPKWTIRNVIDKVPGPSRQDEKDFSKSMGL